MKNSFPLAFASLLIWTVGARAATGGPDAGGYTWNDGVAYNWYDATLGGTALGGPGDTNINFGSYSLGFVMLYYGQSYGAVNICSNGWLSFTDGTSTSAAQNPIPSTNAPLTMIAPLKTFLEPIGNGNPAAYIYYRQDIVGGLNTFAAEWQNCPDGGGFGSSRFTFEVILHSDGTILCQYQNDTSAVSAVTGIENQTGLIGLQVPGSRAANSAVLFTPGQPTSTITLTPTITPTYNTYTPTATATITATFNTYTATLTPTQTLTRTISPSYTATVTLTLTYTPTVTLTPSVPGGGEVAVYPNPFTPGTGTATFVNVPPGSHIAIYTFSGAQVRRFDRIVSPNPTWDGRNDSLESIAAGAYFYVITLPSGVQFTGTLYVVAP